MIKGVIFDMDGLMIDSERVTFYWYRQYLKKTGQDMTEDFYKNLLGKTKEGCKDIMLKEYGSDFEYDKCLQWVHDQMALQFETEGVPVKKGLIKLLEYLKHNGYKTMVATSSDRNRVDVILKNAGIDIYFDGAICGDEVKHGKPDPEVFLKACDKIDIKPEEGLVIEDSEAGIKAAHDGKIKVICIPDMKYPGKEYENMTYEILQNLEQVIPFVQ